MIETMVVLLMLTFSTPITINGMGIRMTRMVVVIMKVLLLAVWVAMLLLMIRMKRKEQEMTTSSRTW